MWLTINALRVPASLRDYSLHLHSLGFRVSPRYQTSRLGWTHSSAPPDGLRLRRARSSVPSGPGTTKTPRPPRLQGSLLRGGGILCLGVLGVIDSNRIEKGTRCEGGRGRHLGAFASRRAVRQPPLDVCFRLENTRPEMNWKKSSDSSNSIILTSEGLI